MSQIEFIRSPAWVPHFLRRGTMIERYSYEYRPYVLFALGLICLLVGGSQLMKASAVLLIATCAYVVYLRYQARVAPNRDLPSHGASRRYNR